MKHSHETDERKIKQITKNIKNLQHIQKIAYAMAPDPTQWEYQGECFDSGPNSNAKCTCGHSIRYIFYVVNIQNHSKIPIGSQCIKSTIPYLITHGAHNLAENLQAAQQKLAKTIAKKYADEKKRQKLHENNIQLQEIIEDMLQFLEIINQYRIISYNDGKYIPYPFYRPLSIPKACKTVGHTLNKLKNTYKTWINMWYRAGLEQKRSNSNNEYPIPMINIPKNTELQQILLTTKK